MLVPSAIVGFTIAISANAAPLFTSGFEHEDEWDAPSDGMCQFLAAAARSGERGLRVVDMSMTTGSNLSSRHVPAEGGRGYKLTVHARMLDGEGVGVYLRFFDQDGKALTNQESRNEVATSVPGGQTDWGVVTLLGIAPAGTTSACVWIHSFNRSVASADLDDVTLETVSIEEAKRVIAKIAQESRPRRFDPPSAERIAQIAALLPEMPGGDGRPITDRAAWEAMRELPSAEAIVDQAVRYLDADVPELPDDLYLEFTRTGNRTNYQRPYGQRMSILTTLVKAECLENSGRFLPAIERFIEAVLTERSWVMPAHDSRLENFNGTFLYPDLGSTARSWALATADYWLGDLLAEKTRGGIRREIRRRTFDPYLDALRSGRPHSGFWWMVGTNNWNPVCNAGVTGAALALVESREERAEFVAGAEMSVPFFLKGFTDDGYCSEGLGYWNYGFGHFMFLGETLWRATRGKLDLFAGGKLPAVASYATRLEIHDGIYPAYADGHIHTRPASWLLAAIGQRYGLSADDVPAYNPLGGSLYEMALVGFRDANAPEVQLTGGLRELRSWFPDAGILVTRAGPGTDPPFGAAIKGGHNGEHHNHNDVGSFTVAFGRKTFLLDPGGEVYTRRTFSAQRYQSNALNSFGHPVPIVAGKLQSKGGKARATVLATEFTDVMDRISLDLKAAYAVPEIRTLVRTFTNRREGRGAIVVEDVVEFSEPCEFGTALITLDRFYRIDDKTLVVYDGEDCVEVRVEAEGGALAFRTDVIDEDMSCRKQPTRLGLDFAEPVAAGTIRLTITPVDHPPSLPDVYRAPDAVTFKPDPDRGITVQAEAFSVEEGGAVEVGEKIGASGRAFKFWDKEGHALEWTFDVEEAGDYVVLVRYCHAVPVARREISIDGRKLGEEGLSFIFPGTGGWSSETDDWSEIWLAQRGQGTVIPLTPGKHTLRMVNSHGESMNLDWIRVVPLLR